MLIVHQSFVYWWQELGRIELHISPLCQQVGLGWARNWEETQPGQLTKSTSSDSPCLTVPRSARKAQGKKKKRGKFGVMAFNFPRNHYLWWRHAFEEVAKHLPANGSSKWIPYFALFVCIDFNSLTKLPLSQSSSPLIFLLFSPPPWRGEWPSSFVGVWLLAGVIL